MQLEKRLIVTSKIALLQLIQIKEQNCVNAYLHQLQGYCYWLCYYYYLLYLL